MTSTIRRELRPEINPAASQGKMQIAIYIDGINMGYAENYKDADTLASEIIAKREAQTAAYLAPRPAPRKAKVKKSACTCPQCQPFGLSDGMFYCKAGREWLAYHNGLLVASGDFLPVEDALRNHRYALLTKGNASPADLDGEQAADVLAALAIVSTTN